MRACRWQVLALLVALLVASRASASVVFVSQEDNGREFALDRGDALEISLPATSGTGYTWQAEPIAGGFARQVGEPAFTLDNAMPGASGLQIFHFGIETSGSGTLELHYLRPWEKGSKPAKVFKIMLIVR
ncbi:MAG: protease inhibitor I42 family protein [Candidatus Binatus sp.]|uniref:protease inhibitor I42 family protein n=1 Tax=Candidatus Binatus sp. TaxID=2811406 RepID=UPI003BB10FDE